MGTKEKIKKKDDAESLLCPFTGLKDTCQTVLCMAWSSTDKGVNDYGYCALITDK